MNVEKKKGVGEGDIFFFFPLKEGKKSEKCLEIRQKDIKNEKNSKKTMTRTYIWNLIRFIFKFKKMIKKLRRAYMCDGPASLNRLKPIKLYRPI